MSFKSRNHLINFRLMVLISPRWGLIRFRIVWVEVFHPDGVHTLNSMKGFKSNF